MRSSRLPLFSVLSGHLILQFLSVFLPVLAAFVLLYVIIDLFDRLDVLLHHHATLSASARYFLFKIPLMITQITPPAVITAVLLAYGTLSRRNEIVALRAAGVSLPQTALPVAAISLGISLLALGWNESVVPVSSRWFQHVNKVEIRKRELRGILSEREIWYRGGGGFYNIDYVDRVHQVLHGLVIYEFDADFRLRAVIEAATVRWNGSGWTAPEARRHVLRGGEFVTDPLETETLPMRETLDDFLEVEREPEELGFAVLRRRILDLGAKGIDASQYLVDLHLKLAVPFANLVLALVAIPIAGRLRRHPSMASIVGLGIAVGFGYWVILGLAKSLGDSGAIPAVLAAWAANTVYLLAAAVLFLSSD